MESEYREMLLLTGLDHITEEELKRFKYFALTEFQIARSTLNVADRTELADQLIQSAGAASAVTKAINIFQKLNYRHIANALEEKKKEAECKFMTNTKKRGTQKVENRSQAENCSAASATRSDKDVKEQAATEVCPQAKPQKKQMVAEQEAIREDLQKDPLVVMVLKAIITEQKDRILYGIHDKTGTMEVLVLGNPSKTKCEEGDKIRLTFFEVSKNGVKIQLKSGPCSFFKVIKAAKPKSGMKSVE
ncbi:interferon-inducible protein AIM2 [Mus pahari]|uniref:interferon-inducible protein AIM2 n=1 Tax=Mus pahari TaxID=10093 RepID=UPI0011148AB8|nr:interferon-inducible protein AIM2 [Mus pahari]